jgi:hypothetical protein
LLQTNATSRLTVPAKTKGSSSSVPGAIWFLRLADRPLLCAMAGSAVKTPVEFLKFCGMCFRDPFW